MTPPLLKASFGVALMTLVSRILGFARDLVIAGLFGVTAETDVFFVAFKIPNFLRRLFAEGAFSQAFVPVLAGALTRSGPKAAREVIAPVLGSFAFFLSLFTVLGIGGSTPLIGLFAPGFESDPGRMALGGSLLSLTLPYLPFIALTALCGGILNTTGHFLLPALTPALLNLALIGAALFLRDAFKVPVTALAVGVLIGGLSQLLIQLFFVAKAGLLPKPRIALNDPAVQQVFGRMLPALFGASIAQVNLLINTFLASTLETGSISWLYYADRLLEFPLGLIGVALGTVILPRLSSLRAQGEDQAFGETLNLGLGTLLILGLPAALGLALLAEPLMLTLFQHDEFAIHDAQMAARSLVAYALGLPGFLAIRVLVPAFSAHEDLRTPAQVGLVAVLLNLLASLLATSGLTPQGFAHAGLAAAVSLSALTNALLLGLCLWRRGWWTPPGQSSGFLTRLLGANLLLAGFLHEAGARFPFAALSALERLGALMLLMTGGLAIYGCSLWLLKLPLRPERGSP